MEIMLHVLDLPINGQKLKKFESNDDLTHLQRGITIITIIILLFMAVILILMIGDRSTQSKGLNSTKQEALN
jgi:hypothetical protein